MSTNDDELTDQFEAQIHAAQLESQKRRLQIDFAERQIKEYLQHDATTKNISSPATSTAEGATAKTTDAYTQQRNIRDLAFADREAVASVLLRELGGETYVPPATQSNGLTANERSPQSNLSRSSSDIILIRTGDKVHPEISFHCTPNYRFFDLLTDACNFYGVPLDDFELVDSNGVKWDPRLSIVQQYATQFQHNIQPIMYLIWCNQLDVGRIYNWRHPKPAYRTEFDVALEGAQQQAKQRTRGAAAALVPQRIQRVLKQMGTTFFIIVLMSIALLFRRNVQSMYFMTQSVRTKLIQQQFGQYMDKQFRTMKDVKDVYEWMEGPMVDSVQMDVDGDSQCTIERSFRQIGALRLRQLRIKKDATCSLSTELPQWESERSKDDADSPLVTFVENCMGNYWELQGLPNKEVETEPYGPASEGDTRDAAFDDKEGFVFNSPTNTTDIQYISTYKNNPEGILQSWWILGDFALYGTFVVCGLLM